MAEETKIRLKIEAVGGNIPAEIRKSLQGVSAELNYASTAAERLHERFFRMNQTVDGIRNVADSLREVDALMGEYTSAFQAQAETKLEQVMRNTMAAGGVFI
ncbi:MAG: hypothetical protein LBC19_10875 [Tannerella sp.]|jgi:methyl-accepting chemotaxis protein|nr:hypothetical protein [Tannerella sp.]